VESRVQVGATPPSNSFSEEGVGRSSIELLIVSYLSSTIDIGDYIPPTFPSSDVVADEGKVLGFKK